MLRSNNWDKYRPEYVLVEILGSSLSSIERDAASQFLEAWGTRSSPSAFKPLSSAAAATPNDRCRPTHPVCLKSMRKTKEACRVCGENARYLWTGKLLDYKIQYFDCSRCGYVQTETPYWLDRAYAAAINDSDTGLLSRNIRNAQVVLATLAFLKKVNGSVIDYAGGYGILVRLLRDKGVSALRMDPFCENLVARGFDYTSHASIPTPALVTAFEAFEHFTDPREELKKMLAIAPNVLLSTELIADPAPPQDQWWYYGKEHGQHIGFFRHRTLEHLAHEQGKHLVSNGRTLHLITEQPVNRVVWMAHLKSKSLLQHLLRFKLKSKTWSDHLGIAESASEASCP